MPARDRRYSLTALISLGNDLHLLIRSPDAATPRSGKHFQPPNRLRLRLVQKISVDVGPIPAIQSPISVLRPICMALRSEV